MLPSKPYSHLSWYIIRLLINIAAAFGVCELRLPLVLTDFGQVRFSRNSDRIPQSTWIRLRWGLLYSQSINLVQNTHWILQQLKSCSTWFRRLFRGFSASDSLRVTVTHWLSLTETDRLSLMPQLSYHVCDLGLTVLPLRVMFILGQIRMTGKLLLVRLGTVF